MRVIRDRLPEQYRPRFDDNTAMRPHPKAKAPRYTTLFAQFLSKLKKAGFSDVEIDELTVQNPSEALAIRVRKL